MAGMDRAAKAMGRGGFRGFQSGVRLTDAVGIPTRGLVALHESAHALVAHAYFENVLHVSLRRKRESAGHVVVRGLVPPDTLQVAWKRAREIDQIAMLEDFALDAARYLLAGHAAESIELRQNILPLDPDSMQAFDYVSVVSRALRAEETFFREWRRCRALVREHWAQVTAIARVLEREGTLRRRQFLGVVSKLPPVRCPRYPRGTESRVNRMKRAEARRIDREAELQRYSGLASQPFYDDDELRTALGCDVGPRDDSSGT